MAAAGRMESSKFIRHIGIWRVGVRWQALWLRVGCPYGAFVGKSARATQTLGGSGPTRSKDAGRGAGTPDALLGRKLLCGEVPE
jgi:hypothetical protein